jgi:hypothetical protein
MAMPTSTGWASRFLAAVAIAALSSCSSTAAESPVLVGRVIKLTDGGRGLSLSYTLEDPVYFTKPITREGVFFKKPDVEFVQQPPCDLDAAQQHLKFER